MQDSPNSHIPSRYSWSGHGMFFAIMIPCAQAVEIAKVFDEIRMLFPIHKHPIPNERLHVSLLPIFAGASLPKKIVETSLLIGNSVRFVEFDLTLNRVLSYRNRQEEKPLVLSADPASTQTINGLVSQMRRAFSILSCVKMRRAGAISPHVTLVWDRVSVPEKPVHSITLPVREFALIHSHIGRSRYDILGRWRLVPR